MNIAIPNKPPTGEMILGLKNADGTYFYFPNPVEINKPISPTPIYYGQKYKL